MAVLVLAMPPALMAAPSELARYLEQVPAELLYAGADRYGPVREDVAAAPIYQGEHQLGWAFLNTDHVSANGYSSRPIHVLAAIDADAVLIGARLLDQTEPLLQSGRRRVEVGEMVAAYAGRDLGAETLPGGSGIERPYVSGVSVSVRVIEDSIVRAGLKVAFALGLGGLEPPPAPDGTWPTVDLDAAAPEGWTALIDEGLVRRLSLENGQVNAAFAASDAQPDARRFPLSGPDEGTFIDLYAALASAPGVAKALLREAYRDDLGAWLEEGDSAILVAARGDYSFRGQPGDDGVFERIAIVQGETTFRLNQRDHYGQVYRLAAPEAPILPEISLFRIPAFAGFDPTRPWRLELLVERRMGAIKRAYLTYGLGYELPQRFIRPPSVTADDLAAAAAAQERDAAIARRNAVWVEKRYAVAGIAVMLALLTGAFFFQHSLARSARGLYWFRIAFLTATLVIIGWQFNAQLSVINLFALFGALGSGFDWEMFLIDPPTFVLWFSVAAALIFWGRGAYCGWLCPFGALQELTNQIGRAFGVPQWRLPWGLHERLWAVKYILFIGLFGATLVSFDLAIRFSEVEPFRTAIALKFARSWPFLLYVLVLLGIGLFVERFYCRYLCPLGAALAIPARLRMFDWLRRYRDCGNPCLRCTDTCFVQAIHPTGEISPNECLGCLHCQVMYHSKTECPVVVRREKRRASDRRVGDPLAAVGRHRVAAGTDGAA